MAKIAKDKFIFGTVKVGEKPLEDESGEK